MSGHELALANLAAWSLQVGVLAIACAAIGRFFPLERPGARLALGQGLLALAVALPLLQPWRVMSAAVSGSLSPGGAASVGAATAGSPAPDRAVAAWPAALGLVLALGATVCLARLGVALARLRRLARSARPLEPLPWLRALRDEVAPRARFAVSTGVGTPASFGLRRPLVLLPPGFQATTRERQAAIALHELLHVRRRDWPVLVLEELLAAALFFHPAIHWLVGRVRLAREQCVDAAVVRRLGGRDAYLESLVEAARARAAAPLPAAPFLRESHLRERVELLLKEAPMSAARTLRNAVVTAILLLVALALTASALPLQAKPAPGAGAAQAADAEPTSMPKLIHRVNPVYPPDAKTEGVQGIFLLDLVIGEDGTIQDAAVAVSAPTFERLEAIRSAKGTKAALEGDARLAAAALEAVRQWRYEPVVKGGKPVEVKATVTVNFKLA